MCIRDSNNPLWLNLKNSNTNGYSLSNTRNATGTGFLNKKFIVPNGVYLSSGSTSGDKFRIILIRMAELYLNLAECYAALDRTDEALENLNVIRERAGVRKLTTADLSTMSLMEWVRNERAIELHAEGHRYYDVRRWRIADQVMPVSYTHLDVYKRQIHDGIVQGRQLQYAEYLFGYLARLGICHKRFKRKGFSEL